MSPRVSFNLLSKHPKAVEDNINATCDPLITPNCSLGIRRALPGVEDAALESSSSSEEDVRVGDLPPPCRRRALMLLLSTAVTLVEVDLVEEVSTFS